MIYDLVFKNEWEPAKENNILDGEKSTRVLEQEDANLDGEEKPNMKMMKFGRPRL